MSMKRECTSMVVRIRITFKGGVLWPMMIGGKSDNITPSSSVNGSGGEKGFG